ncbi:hypothetical protein SDC9_200913 [bioreactor metagenome]|uniref:Uncharacterized protein n=1 Tax=bioreactor metagenome TaxID=1076179 RepID=A0A645IS87_9ZZZZ
MRIEIAWLGVHHQQRLENAVAARDTLVIGTHDRQGGIGQCAVQQRKQLRPHSQTLLGDLYAGYGLANYSPVPPQLASEPGDWS